MHRQTALITAASIAAVVVTGAAAVGANIGILSSAGASDVGQLTAVAQVASVEPIPTVTTSTTTESAFRAPMTSQVFEADVAGLVEVWFGGGQVRLGEVDASVGWMWTSTQSGPSEVTVRFLSDGDDEFEFVAEVLDDGTLTARVDEYIVQTVVGDAEVITVVRSDGSPTAPPTAGGTAVPSAGGATPSPTSIGAGSPAPGPTLDAPDDSDGRLDDLEDEREDRLDDLEDEREDRLDDLEDEREDRLDALEDARDGRSDDEYEGADDDD